MKEILSKLGLDGVGILFYFVNLTILSVALYLLLYKPVKRIIANHRKALDDIYRENARLRQETATLKDAYAEMKKKALQENEPIRVRAAEQSGEVRENAEKKTDERR